jgi:hypothetical protein
MKHYFYMSSIKAVSHELVLKTALLLQCLSH